MKITSRDFYREMRGALAAQMKVAGFSSLKGDQAGWQRPAGQGVLALWFQCDKWGWEPVWGSRFNLEFSLREAEGGAGVPAAPGRAGQSERLGFLVEGCAEMEELRLLNNAVIARLPGTREGKLVLGRLRDGREYVMQGCRADPAPFEVGFDYWLGYHSLEDVRAWAAWFAAKMPRLVGMFESGERSELGQGRRRFDRVIGAAQALPDGDAAGKLALFEAYQREEPNPYWKSVAGYWIGEFRAKAGAA